MRSNGNAEKVWNFDYSDLVHVWRNACRALRLTAYVPYQLRHGGPSHDRLQQTRSLEAIQKRGRWKQLRSVARYEKAGRVAQEAMKLSLHLRRYGKRVLQQLKEILSGRLPPPELPHESLR